MEEYITSNEGEKLLGISRQMFFYYVNQNKIEKKPGETPRKALYKKSDIIRLKREIGDSNTVNTNLLIDWVKPIDVPKTVALDLIVYDENILGDLKLYLSWIKKNPQISLAAFDEKRERVLAYLALLPLDEQIILSVLKGERAETSITAEEIKTFEEGGEYDLLVESIVAHPDYPEAIGSIMNHMTAFWCDMWPHHKLRRLYAQAISDQGIYLVNKLFFAPLFGFPNDAYVLDLQRKNFSKVVRRYQECIQQKSSL